MANMTFKTNLLPNSNLGYSLGTANLQWNIYGNIMTNPFHTALTSKGTTVTTAAGETYGMKGKATGANDTIYSKWYVNLNTGIKTPTNGMVIQIKIPVDGVNSGCAITLDGTNFYPVAYSTATRLTTHFATNDTITLQFDSARTVAAYGTKAGASSGTATTNIVGCWRVLNCYDSNTTYSTMSVAEMTGGTATSARTMRADYLNTYLSRGLELSYYDNSEEIFYIKTDIPANSYPTMIYGYIQGNGYNNAFPIHVDFQAYNYTAEQLMNCKQYDATNAIGVMSCIRGNDNLIYFKVARGCRWQTYKIFIYQHNDNNKINHAISVSTTAPTVDKEVELTKIYGFHSGDIIDIAHGGTGADTAAKALDTDHLLSGIDAQNFSSALTDDTIFLSSSIYGFTSNHKGLYQRNLSALNTYIQGKTTISTTWSKGTTTGPTLHIVVNSKTASQAIPIASKTQSGAISTGAQNFLGRKGFGFVSRYGYKDDGAATEYVADTILYNNAGTQVGEFWYDVGGTTNITRGQYLFRSYSPNTTANTATTGNHETYALPNVTVGRTSNAVFNILTSKNAVTIAQGGTGASNQSAAVNSLQAWSLSGGSQIPENADLNAYKTFGNYYQQNTVTAQTIVNNPYNDNTSLTAFQLKVISGVGNGSANYIRQELYEYNKYHYFVRISTNGGSSWQAWLPVAKGNSRVYSGTCPTAATAAAKEVICNSYPVLTKGDIVFVTFGYTNSEAVASLTLNVNDTGAKPLKCFRNGAIANLPSAGYLLANQTYQFYYDGTNWVTILDYNTNTNTLLRVYSSATDLDVPLIGQSSANSITATWSSYTGTYKDWYGAIPNNDEKRAKINLSSGMVKMYDLTIADQTAPRIAFTRPSFNYLEFPRESGSIAVIGTGTINGTTYSRNAANSSVIINKDSVYPGTADAINLGILTKEWAYVYSKKYIVGETSYGTTNPNDMTWAVDPVVGQVYFYIPEE